MWPKMGLPKLAPKEGLGPGVSPRLITRWCSPAVSQPVKYTQWGGTEFIREGISALGSLPFWGNSQFYLRVGSLPLIGDPPSARVPPCSPIPDSTALTRGTTTDKMLRPWLQQARQLTPRRGTVAHLGNQGCCVHIHKGNLSLWLVAIKLGLLLNLLAFTRYSHYQYYMACIAIKDGPGETLYCAIV